MKIGLDVAQTCTPRAGCAWYADSLARSLVQIAPQDDFFLYHQFGTLINPDTSAGTHIVAPNATPTFTDITPQEAQRIWGSPHELLIKTWAPDLVHAMSFRAPRVPGAKIVFTVYDVSFWAVPQFTTEENRLVCQHGVLEALANADGFIFISQSSHDEFERYLPGWLERHQRPWIVTPLAPRTHQRVAPPANQADHYWLAVGSIEPRKNYETLLDAFELYWQSSKRPHRLRIAGGRGWKSDRIHARMAEFRARGMLDYLNYVPDDQLLSLYAGAEALIFPSWYEGFGLPLIEAMAQGCPVLSSNSTSLREAGGEAALYFNPGSPQELAAIMLRIENEPGVRVQMVTNGLTHSEGFNWTETARRTLAFYRHIAARS